MYLAKVSILSSKYLITDKNRLKYIMREKQIEDEIMEHNRLITFDGTVNFRDIGGYENNEGKHVKWGKIYRSDSLSSLTKRDEEKLEEMKVTVDCDLRTSNEQLMAPDRKWNGVEVLDCHVYAEDSSGNFVNDSHKLYRFLHHIPKVNSYLGEIYQNVI